jgi:hypothetical protein
VVRAGGVLPGEDLPVRVEVIHQSERTLVTRLFFPGRTVVCKEPLRSDAERRVRDETAVLERLRGLAGIVQLAGGPRYPESIVLADAAGTSQAGVAKPLAAADLIGLAASRARIVAAADQVREIARRLHPSVLSEKGLGAALETLAFRSPVPVTRAGTSLRAELPLTTTTTAGGGIASRQGRGSGAGPAPGPVVSS